MTYARRTVIAAMQAVDSLRPGVSDDDRLVIDEFLGKAWNLLTTNALYTEEELADG